MLSTAAWPQLSNEVVVCPGIPRGTTSMWGGLPWYFRGRQKPQDKEISLHFKALPSHHSVRDTDTRRYKQEYVSPADVCTQQSVPCS